MDTNYGINDRTLGALPLWSKDKKSYKLNFLKESGATITCELPNKDELIGDYDVEDKKKYLELFKI